MIKQSELRAIIEDQKSRLSENKSDLKRNLLNELPTNLENHALIISGIRRCGKSTLLRQLMKDQFKIAFFVNFDTPKLFNFELKDFEILDLLIEESGERSLFFDELQVISGWELYVRQKLDQGFRVIITGSNASLLSQELGTKLTGRHITKELFPFSFSEFIHYNLLAPNIQAIQQYLDYGGFPEYLKYKNPDILTELFDDILYRDIAVRYSVRDVKSLKRLLIFLVTNVSNLVSATKLSQPFGIKSTTTVLTYFSFFEQAYLLNFMPKFSYSYRAQIINPRKIYVIDNGLINVLSSSFSLDLGRKLENTVYWALRRKYKELYYYNESGFECDFVICNNNIPQKLIQVCYDLNSDNTEREEKGIMSAMSYFKLESGVIVTLNQNDIILNNERRIDVIPAYDFLSMIE